MRENFRRLVGLKAPNPWQPDHIEIGFVRRGLTHQHEGDYRFLKACGFEVLELNDLQLGPHTQLYDLRVLCTSGEEPAAYNYVLRTRREVKDILSTHGVMIESSDSIVWPESGHHRYIPAPPHMKENELRIFVKSCGPTTLIIN